MSIDPKKYEATNTVANPRTAAIEQNAITQRGILGGAGTVAVSSSINNPTIQKLTQLQINSSVNAKSENFNGGKHRRRLRKRKTHKKRRNKKKRTHRRK